MRLKCSYSILFAIAVFAVGSLWPILGSAQVRCETVFGIASPRAIKYWNEFDLEVASALQQNLQNEKIYDTSLNHVKTLQKKFGIVVGKDHQAISVKQIIETYEKVMNEYIAKKIFRHDQVLRPAFLFSLPSGEILWRKYGEEVPEEAVRYSGELPLEFFNKMILRGLFPVGDTSLTSTKQSVFEHDLGHLTSFIEHPLYMSLLVKFVRDNHKGRWKELGPWGETALKDRHYVLFEGMTVVNRKNKDRLMKVLLPAEMRHRLDEINLSEMITYLKSEDPEVLQKKIAYLKKNHDQYFTPYGGAARNAIENAGFTGHNTFLRILAEATWGKSPNIEKLAKYYLMAIKLRDITIEDWFDQTFKYNISEDSKIFAAINNSGLTEFWNYTFFLKTEE